ncbi:ATP-dependent sacrificial sulfur transferase LarE [Candidatus Woesearchaeota archaeon]|nr:ATP-dependent sacrificial sulfur transferase LarE [Candidatus Woesearchaeota archaeon]
MEAELIQKFEYLKNEIKKLDSAIVAFSGGVDSALVLKAAFDILKENAVAVTADSLSLPRRELDGAKRIAERIGAKHLIIKTEETENADYLKNPGNRCYYCKSELYKKLKLVSIRLRIKNILNGTNFDDLSDYRPGLKAADENKIISPLKDAKLTKNDVRELARHLDLEVWNKPSSPCLSSRIPYGNEIAMKKLRMVEEAENFLKDMGIKELRVRHFGNTARIEVNEEDQDAISANIKFIEKKFSEIGFGQIETSNFKSGSMNLMINVRAEN